ncbi:MAG: putative transposase [Ardenticatenaceae bacterium]|nr:MAG: putative transposase [Ardenticatenaceae bacterium]
MAGKQKQLMDIIGLLQHFRAGDSDREISRVLNIHRKTVRKYRQWATQYQLLEMEKLPPPETIQHWLDVAFGQKRPAHMVSTVEPYRQEVIQWRSEGLTQKAIWLRLEKRGYPGSYGAVSRFIGRLEKEQKLANQVTVRVERPPGDEAQVDFGYAGKMVDETTGEIRRAWMFVITLSWSRHQYVEFVFDQRLETWLRCHRRAFTFFGGVPRRVVVDNLKAAIIRACFEEPQAQLAYRECAEHYGFLIAPCRPYTPQHKGKVERSVQYVKQNFLGSFEGRTIQAANRAVKRWCLETAGLRIHGTTKEQPLARFQQTELAQLQPLPAEPYDLAIWKKAKCHRDGYIVFDNAYYSVPFRLLGQFLMVRGGTDTVRLYTTNYQLVATHSRATQAGQRLTNLAHLPATHVAGLTMTREMSLQTAQEIGPETAETVAAILGDTAVDRLPTARRLLKLRHVYGNGRLEAACLRANQFGDPTYKTVKGILLNSLDEQEIVETATPKPATRFVRQASDILGQWVEGLRWN